jgi:homoserine dehydrogenase
MTQGFTDILGSKTRCPGFLIYLIHPTQAGDDHIMSNSDLKEIRIALAGFGNVGQAFARLLLAKEATLAKDFGLHCTITGISTGRHGAAIHPQGIDLPAALKLAAAGDSLDALSTVPAPSATLDFIRACPADVLIEISPVNHLTGQPAASHLQAALEMGMHAITANKGPVVHAYAELTQLAQKQGKRFLFESAVMDGAPIFSLFRGPLPAAELRAFHGILNSCTNLLLERMENGETLEEAVVYGHSIGITETDPSADIDGWDAAIKVCALVTVLMGTPLKPQDIQREGIRAITAADITQAKQAGERWKLVCQARRTPDGVQASVCPQRVGPDSPLYTIRGTSSFVQFEMDVLPGLGIIEGDPGPDTTAYGLLADLLNALRDQ